MRSIGPNRLTMDGNDVGQADVIRAVGMSFDVMVNAVIMGQRQKLFYDLAPRDKMQLFVDALNLDLWDACAQTASTKSTKLSSIAAELIGEEQGLRTSIETIDAMVKEQEAKSKGDAPAPPPHAPPAPSQARPPARRGPRGHPPPG